MCSEMSGEGTETRLVMLCADFEQRLTEYVEGALPAAESRAVAEHAMRCPVCHELLGEVKNTIAACRTSEPAVAARADLESRILMETTPGAGMTCVEFQDLLTDYLDGFLPAIQYHRWERHAAICEDCTELPGQVVRAIGACYTYITEEQPVPAGLHERILEATIGTVEAERVRPPLGARLIADLRMWLDSIFSPQLATVATMLLVAVLVLTNTVSADGSISGMYRASVKLAEQSSVHEAVKNVSLPNNFKQLKDDITNLMESRAPADAPVEAEAGRKSGTEARRSPSP